MRRYLLLMAALLMLPTGVHAGKKSEAKKKATWPPKGIIFVDGIIGIVNREPITWYQLRQAARPQVAKLRSEATSTTDVRKRLRQIYREVLDALMDDVLVYNRAKAKGVEVE